MVRSMARTLPGSRSSADPHGAHLALLAAYTAGAPPVSAVVSLYGPTDLTRGFREPPRPDPIDVRAILQAFVGGTPDDQPEAYTAASPITYATHPQPPTLLIYGRARSRRSRIFRRRPP